MADGNAIELATGYISLAVSTKGLGKQVAGHFAGFEKQAVQSGTVAGRSLSGGVKASLTGLVGSAARTGADVGRKFGGGVKTAALAGISDLKSVAAGGALALGGLAVAGATVGIKTAASMEQAKIAFTTMLGSGKKADTFLRGLAKFAAETPFEFPELQTAASSLVSAGINADKVIPIMRTLGDVTSGMGTGAEGVKRATVALQQMNAAGKITGEDLNQLRDAGIPVYDLLASATGKSKAEVVKLAAAGKLGKTELDEMMKALESGKGLERFSGLMDKQSKSLTGMFSTLKDTLGQGLAKAIEPSLPLIKQGLGALSTGLGSVFKWVGDNKGSLSEFFGVVGSSLKTMKTLSDAWLDPFLKSLTGGKSVFKSFADFMGTHQSEITDGLIAGAGFAIDFASALGTLASVGLKAFAFLTDAQADLTAVMLVGFKSMLNAAAIAFGWVPGLGDKLADANSKFDGFATGLVSGMHDSADSARNLADGIDTKMTPALAAARKGLDKAADQQKLQAASRDTAYSIGLIGTTAQGNQIHLKKFSDISKLSADQQAALRGRLGDSQKALRDQLGSMKAAGSGQAALTKAWKTGKDRLYDEFRQMGLSKTEAGKLATKYAGIKPKVETKITQPGMKGAQADAKTLKDHYDRIPNSKTIRINFDTAVDSINTKLTYKGGKGARLIGVATGGVLPGYTPGRDVHHFASPTGGRLALSGGEAVMRPEFTRAVGRGEINRINRAARTRGVRGVRNELGLASGGIFDLVAKDGGRAVGDEGTRIIASALKRLTKGVNGPVGAGGYKKALGYARAHVGHPYIFASLWDCSGFMSALQSIILGQSPHRRYTTTAFHGSRAAGFTRGKRSPFMVGVRPLSGKFGHMAGTLNGVNVESAGGVGVRVGKNARGYNNGMFSWRGGMAKGGIVGDLPFDLLDPAGQRYNKRLADAVELMLARPKVKGGYAAGTREASPGWHPVGERGPELVKFRGGEQVRTTTKSTSGGLTINGNVIGTDVEALAEQLEKKRRRAEALQPV